MSPLTATLIGLIAVLLWSLLAVFTVASGEIPPFQLNAMCFLVGGLVGIATWVKRPGRARALIQPVGIWAFGIAGLFGYHALYFAALRLAPPAEAGLVNYLWPLLIVLFSGLLPGERLKAIHVVGALIAFSGVVVLSLGSDIAARPEHLAGYICALGAALFWSSYSVLSRRIADVPTDAVVGFCFGTAILSLLFHLVFETTIWPADATQWLAVLALGLGPVGAAFYAWDIGCKRGDIRLLGVGAYAAPVLSTLALVMIGYSQATVALWAACLLIVGGALVASSDKLRRSPRAAPIVAALDPAPGSPQSPTSDDERGTR
jgi:drug/metabolite transporter (DMT)-like permease